jgi:hypothetical protein
MNICIILYDVLPRLIFITKTYSVLREVRAESEEILIEDSCLLSLFRAETDFI